MSASPVRPLTRSQQHLRLALGLMVVAQFMVVLDFSIVNVALPTIERVLKFSPTSAEAVITGYATAFGGVLILGGRLADLYGRRRVFIAGLLWFAAASLACAVATDSAFLVIARVAQGLGAALLAPSALALLTTTFSEGNERNRALGIFGAATAAGFVSGQILGGVLTDVVGWRSIFVINVPVAAVAAAATVWAIPADGRGSVPRIPDLPGAALITTSMALLVWAPTRGADRGWTSSAFLLPLAGALLLLATFWIVEKRSADPLIQLSMLRSRWVAGTNAATAVTGALNGTVVLLCTLFLQRVHGYSPLQAGVAFIPTGLAGLLIATRYAGPIISRHGVRMTLGTASLIAAVAIAGLSRLPGAGGYPPLLPWLTIIGASFTLAAVATTVAISTGVAANQQGVAAAVRQTAFQLGVALGVAALLSIAASHTNTLLAGPHPPTLDTALTSGYRLALGIIAILAALGGLIAFATLRQHPATQPTYDTPSDGRTTPAPQTTTSPPAIQQPETASVRCSQARHLATRASRPHNPHSTTPTSDERQTRTHDLESRCETPT